MVPSSLPDEPAEPAELAEPAEPAEPGGPGGPDEARFETGPGLDGRAPAWGRVRRADAEPRWWPMPLWLWAVVIAVLTAAAIAVVAALGGHQAVVGSIVGDQGRLACPNGRLRSRNLSGGYDCSLTWQGFYVLAGIGAFGFVVLYRWTIDRRHARRWPGR